MAITNARLYEETQKSLIEADMLYRRNLLTGWRKLSQAQKIAGVHRSGMTTDLYASSVEIPGEREVIDTGSAYINYEQNSEMTLPVKLRGEIVGMLNVKVDGERKWTEDEMDIINAIVGRAALSIENARLLAESRLAVEKERAISDISAKISTNSQIETILKTVVRELGNQIGNAQVSIEIGTHEE
jgi:transcriptional regulator with GAF, ATPase, and Fis domain